MVSKKHISRDLVEIIIYTLHAKYGLFDCSSKREKGRGKSHAALSNNFSHSSKKEKIMFLLDK